MANCTEEAGTENVSGLPQELCTLAPSDLIEGSNLEPSRVDPLIHSHPTVAYVYIAIMAAALVIGSGGNVLILLVIGTLRNFQRTGKMFIVNLALADICVAAIADPMCVIAVVKGERWFDDKKWLCEAVATICLTACFCAFLSLTLASLNRFVFICHNAMYDKVFTAKTSIAACVLVWIAAFSFEAPNFLGWGDHYFDPKSHQCIWDRTASFSYTMFVSVGLILTPLVAMLLCYILIFRHIYRTKYNLYIFNDSDPFRLRKTWLETLRTSRMLLGIFVVFLVCWVPYGIVIVFDFYQKLSVELHLFFTMLAHLHSSANCIVYITTNRSFRQVVLNRLGCGWFALSGSESGTKSTKVAKVSHVHTNSNSPTVSDCSPRSTSE